MRSLPPIVFLHLFKCGGTSVIDRMARIVGHDRLYHAKSAELLQRDIDDARSPLHDAYVVAGHIPMTVIDGSFGDAPIVTVLRDPVDRMISQYFHFRREGLRHATAATNADDGTIRPGHRYRCAFCAEHGFDRFVASDDDRIRRYTVNYMARRIAGDRARNADKNPSKLLKKAIDNLDRFAMVLTTERIDADFDDHFKALVTAHFGGKIGRSLSWPARRKKNVASNRGGDGLQVDTETLERLIERNRVDLALHAARRWFTPCRPPDADTVKKPYSKTIAP